MSDIFDYPTLGEQPSMYQSQISQVLSRAGDTRCLGVPFRIDDDGAVAVSEGRGHILRQEMFTLLMTYLGERLMMPYYGSNVAQYVWEPQSSGTVDAFLAEMDSLITENFAGVQVLDLSINDDDSYEGALSFNFEYIYDNEAVSMPIDATDLLTGGPTS